MRTRDVNALRDALASLLGEIGMVRASFSIADFGAPCADPHRNNREWCAVYLNDAWSRFCRRLVLSSALCEPQTLSAILIPRVAGLASETAALARLRGHRRPPFWEPRWYDAVVCGRACHDLGVANTSQIVAALGSTPSPASDLNHIRNFIAHRNRDTATKLRVVLTKYKVPTTTGTSSRAIIDTLLSQPVGTGARFDEWCGQLEQIAVSCVA